MTFQGGRQVKCPSAGTENDRPDPGVSSQLIVMGKHGRRFQGHSTLNAQVTRHIRCNKAEGVGACAPLPFPATLWVLCLLVLLQCGHRVKHLGSFPDGFTNIALNYHRLKAVASLFAVCGLHVLDPGKCSWEVYIALLASVGWGATMTDRTGPTHLLTSRDESGH